MRERIDGVRSRLREEALRRGFKPRDVDLLLADITGRSTAWVIAHGEEEIDPAPLEAMLARRFAGEPLQYIRGKTEFFSREFLVDDRALIPRPETEVLVEMALGYAPPNARVVDVGTGSGCIAISLERTRPDLRVVGIDYSLEALTLAKINRDRLGSRVQFALSDFLGSVRNFDLVVSNPPYVPEDEVDRLMTEVRDHEPKMALTPGPKGTEAIERILAQAGRTPVIFEMGYLQTPAVRALASAYHFHVETVVKDLAGIERVVVLSPAW